MVPPLLPAHWKRFVDEVVIPPAGAGITEIEPERKH
jgi:hypothetical protein